jgi:hypothetical protein
MFNYDSLLIHGQKYNGKSTLACKLSKALTERNIGNYRASFADSLKREVSETFPDPEKALAEMYDPTKKEAYREVLTTTADALKETHGIHYFAEQVAQGHVFFHTPESDIPIIDDFRYEYERNALCGYTMRPFCIKIVRPGVTYAVTHSSEEGLPDYLFEYILVNNFEGEDSPEWDIHISAILALFGV